MTLHAVPNFATIVCHAAKVYFEMKEVLGDARHYLL